MLRDAFALLKLFIIFTLVELTHQGVHIFPGVEFTVGIRQVNRPLVVWMFVTLDSSY